MRITAMVVYILIGARVFSLVFQGVGGKEWIEHLLTSLPGGQVGFLIFVNVFIFVVAFFLDFFEIAFIIIPLLAPVADKLGIDSIWFGVLICANIQTSFMHPPFGFALFYLRGIAPPSDQDIRNLLGRDSLGVPAGDPRRHRDLLAGIGDLLDRQGSRHRPGQDRNSAAAVGSSGLNIPAPNFGPTLPTTAPDLGGTQKAPDATPVEPAKAETPKAEEPKDAQPGGTAKGGGAAKGG